MKLPCTGRLIIAPTGEPLSQRLRPLTAPLTGEPMDAPHKFPQLGVPAEAQPVRYPQGVCRIRSAAKLLTAALLGSVGKGGVPQGDFLRAKGSERSFSPQRRKRSSRTFRRRGSCQRPEPLTEGFRRAGMSASLTRGSSNVAPRHLISSLYQRSSDAPKPPASSKSP